MSAPIRTKPRSSMKIDNAPTPHNTPASVLTGSFLKNGNPLKANSGAGETSAKGDTIPQTISEEDIQSALSKQPFLLQSIQDKLGSLVGQDSGYVGQLPENVKERIYGLKKIQNDLFALEKDFQVEMFELEQKYLSKYSPLHERRYKIVSGREEPTGEEVNKGKELAVEEGEEEEAEVEEKPKNEEEQDIKGIPSFWLTALENLPVVSDTITDRDAEVLDFLMDIKLEYLSDGRPGFKLVFVFDEDIPFFKNKTLTKTYFYQSELGYSGDFIYDHAEGEEIQWVDNESNVTISVEMRKQRNKATKQVRTIEKITPVDSFFNFFDPPKVPNKERTAQDVEEEEQDEEQDEDELQELEERLALDYSIGEQLKDKLVPRAIDWFTGAALEFEFDNELAEDEGFEDEDDEDDDDDDDDEGEDDDDQEEEEHDDFARKEAPPECKQS